MGTSPFIQDILDRLAQLEGSVPTASTDRHGHPIVPLDQEVRSLDVTKEYRRRIEDLEARWAWNQLNRRPRDKRSKRYDFVVSTDPVIPGTHFHLSGTDGAYQRAIQAGGDRTILVLTNETFSRAEDFSEFSNQQITIEGLAERKTVLTAFASAALFAKASNNATPNTGEIVFRNITLAANSADLFDVAALWGSLRFDHVNFSCAGQDVIDIGSIAPGTNSVDRFLYAYECTVTAVNFINLATSGQLEGSVLENCRMELTGVVFNGPGTYHDADVHGGQYQVLRFWSTDFKWDQVKVSSLTIEHTGANACFSSASGSTNQDGLILTDINFLTAVDGSTFCDFQTATVNENEALIINNIGAWHRGSDNGGLACITVDTDWGTDDNDNLAQIGLFTIHGWTTQYSGPDRGASHSLLSTVHDDTVVSDVSEGSIIVGNGTPAYAELVITVPSSGLRNALAVDNGETVPTWKATLDTTNATALGSAAPGTSLIYSHRDHVHNHPSSLGVDLHHNQAHALLSTAHSDTLASDVTRGSILAANSTPVYAELDIGAAGTVLWTAGSDPVWTGDVRLRGYLRIGNPAVPTNTDAGDLTYICGFGQTHDLVHTASENDEHALEIDVLAGGFDDIKAIDIQYTTGTLAAGEDDEAILVDLDENAAGGGRFSAFEMLTTTTGGVKVEGLFAGVGVHPVEQLSGTFDDPDRAEVEGVDKLTDLVNPSTNVNIFETNTDVMILGNADKFEEIEYILSTGSSGAGIKPKFEFSSGAGPTWAEFGPSDGTNGMRNTGIIVWEDTDISDVGTWTKISGNYLIRITRQRVSLTTEPVCSFLQIAVAQEYSWNKSAVLTVAAILLHNASGTEVADLDITGNADFAGYLHTGSASNPTNTTAGDLTVRRLFVTDTSLESSARLMQVSDTYTPGTGQFNSLFVTVVVDPGVGQSTDDQRAATFAITVQPTANYTGTTQAFFASTLHDSGSFNIAAMRGFFAQAIQDVGSTTVTVATGAQVAYRAKAGTITTAVGYDIVRGNGADAGAIGTGIGLRIGASVGVTPTTDIAIQSLGGQHRFVGNVRIGANTAPTVALDVTGAALISSTLGVTGATTLTGGIATSTTLTGTLTTTANIIVQGGSLTVGVDDTTSGLIKLFGASAGQEGGELQLYLTAGNQSNFTNWSIDTNADDLRFFQSSGEQAMRLRGSGGNPSALFPYEVEIDGALNHDGSTAGFYGTAPITQALLATGVGATVDNVITALQNLGLVKQA